MSDGPSVKVRGLTRRFGAATVLAGVDLTVGPGRVHGLLGPNGAGKSTLLAVLFGLLEPDAGTVELLGRTRSRDPQRYLDGVAGFVETPRFYPYLTGTGNLQLLARLDGPDAHAMIPDVLEVAGLTAAAGAKVRGYSLGMRQRLGLAAALLRRPRLLILDEPLNGLDPAGMRDLLSSVRQLAADGMAVLLSSHDMSHVDEVCDEVTVLHQGRVALTGSLPSIRAAAPDPVWRLATSDDTAAIRLADGHAGVMVAPAEGDLLVTADAAHLEAFTIGLGRAGVAIRALRQDVTPLEATFFRLTQPAA